MTKTPQESEHPPRRPVSITARALMLSASAVFAGNLAAMSPQWAVGIATAAAVLGVLYATVDD